MERLKLFCFVLGILLAMPAAATNWSIGMGFERESFGDADLGHASDVLKLMLSLDNADTFSWQEMNEFLFEIDTEMRWEPSPEKYDSDRMPMSWEADALIEYPVARMTDDGMLGMSLGLSWTKNSQQLEEFERLIYLGPSLRWHHGMVQTHAILALACNEEEKDDERPRERLGLDRDVLNRKGCGSYTTLRSDYLNFNQWALGLDLSHYRGDYGDQYYRKFDVGVAASYSFNNADRCTVRLQSINRNAELDLLGMRDRVERLMFECRRQY